MDDLRMDPAFAERNVNEGFSGGEKKRHEILQLELLKPKFAILDETDSGLDVDALQGRLRGRQPGQGERRRRRPADHALHADPALHQARLRARVRRRPDRRGGRPGAGRPPRGRGLRPVPVDGASALTLSTVDDASTPRRLGAGRSTRPSSPPCARTSRSCARTVRDGRPLVYLDSGATSQKPRRCSTPSGTSTSSTTPPCTAARTSWPRRPPRRSRTPGPRSRRSSASPPDEVVLTKNATEGHQPRGLRDVATRRSGAGGAAPSGSRSAPATRSSSPRWSTTRTSCRGRSSAAAPAPRCAGSGRRRAAGSTWPTLDTVVTERTKVRRVHARVQRARHDQPGRADRRPGPRGRRARRARRLPVRAAPAGRPDARSASTSLAFSGHKMLGPTGVGVLCGPPRAARRPCRRS